MNQLKTQNYVDDQFKRKAIIVHRVIARGIVFDENRNIAIHNVVRDDIFGKASYYETPGGGVKVNETLLEGLKRECLEELGVYIEPLGEVALVNDEYALIGRSNENHYFIAKKTKDSHTHLVSKGDCLIHQTLWISLDEAISLYEKMKDNGIEKLVKQRELPILKFVKKLLDSKELDDFLQVL